MTSTLPSKNYGRFCNQIFRNLSVSRIAEKHDLCVTYAHYEQIQELGIPLFSGKRTFETTTSLTDDNYFSIYNSDTCEYNLDANKNFFQTSDISKLLYTYLHTSQNNIKIKNPFYERYNSNNDVYVHIRLTDVLQWNPGHNYYLKTISGIEFDKLYISSDDPEHPMVKQIQKQYPDSTILLYNEVKTIQFASTCKHIVLSHGSFSAVIGYLSFFSDVHYPEYESGKMWYGDIFSIDGWIKHST
jgi:hypothetical protein